MKILCIEHDEYGSKPPAIYCADYVSSMNSCENWEEDDDDDE